MLSLFAQTTATPPQAMPDFDKLIGLLRGPWAIGLGVLGLVSLVCFIMVLVKMFQHGKTGLGIITILTTFCPGCGPLIAFIYGWVKSGEWNMKGLMLVWTLVILLNFAIVGYLNFVVLPTLVVVPANP